MACNFKAALQLHVVANISWLFIGCLIFLFVTQFICHQSVYLIHLTADLQDVQIMQNTRAPILSANLHCIHPDYILFSWKFFCLLTFCCLKRRCK